MGVRAQSTSRPGAPGMFREGWKTMGLARTTVIDSGEGKIQEVVEEIAEEIVEKRNQAAEAG